MYPDFKKTSTDNSSSAQYTKPNGNCAYNSIALFIHDCFLNIPLFHPDITRFTSILNGHMVQDGWDSRSADGYRELFSTFSADMMQDILAPVLRRMVVDTMRDPRGINNHKQLLLDDLIYMMDFSSDSNPPHAETFLVHDFLNAQLMNVRQTFPDQPVQQKDAMKQWWLDRGFILYLAAIEQPASGADDRARWGGDIELNVLGNLFQIKICMSWDTRKDFALGLKNDSTCRVVNLHISGQHWSYLGQTLPDIIQNSKIVDEQQPVKSPENKQNAIPDQRGQVATRSKAPKPDYRLPKWLRRESVVPPATIKKPTRSIKYSGETLQKICEDYQCLSFDILMQKKYTLVMPIFYLYEKGWLNEVIAEQMINYDQVYPESSSSIWDLATALEKLRRGVGDLPSWLGQACVFAMLQHPPETLEDVVYILIQLKKKGLLTTLEIAWAWLDLVATHPAIKQLYSLVKEDILDNSRDYDDFQNIRIMQRFKKNDPALNRVESGEYYNTEGVELYKALKLDLGLNGNCANAVQQLALALGSNTSVQFFHLPSHYLNTLDIEAIADMLAENKTLKELRLTYCEMDAEDVATLARGLQANTTLSFLDLSGNPIGDEGAATIANVINHSGLTRLRLSACKIGDEGLIALSRVFPAHQPNAGTPCESAISTQLTRLDLSTNSFGDVGVLSLAARDISLLDLDLSFNNFGTAGAMALFYRLRYCSSLKILDIAHCEFENEGLNLVVDRLAALLEHHSGLEKVSLTCTNLFYKEYGKQLQAARDKNKRKIKVPGLEEINPYRIWSENRKRAAACSAEMAPVTDARREPMDNRVAPKPDISNLDLVGLW